MNKPIDYDVTLASFTNEALGNITKAFKLVKEYEEDCDKDSELYATFLTARLSLEKTLKQVKTLCK